MRIKFASSLALLAALTATPILAQDDAVSANAEFPTLQALADEANGVVSRHGDWEIRCQDDSCRMFLAAFDDEGNEVANISMQTLPEGAAAKLGVVVITPLLSLLPRGVTMGIDDGVPASYPYSWCDRAGCYARFGMTDAQIDAMKSGNSAYLSIYTIVEQDSEIRANISLTGFTAAFEELTAN
ncbi:MAG: invasion associated locus B family protein [Rhodobacteraceae bacterium]|nr:invasion associated locus B family protein [Paracoccaceae bacterium]